MSLKAGVNKIRNSEFYYINIYNKILRGDFTLITHPIKKLSTELLSKQKEMLKIV